MAPDMMGGHYAAAEPVRGQGADAVKATRRQGLGTGDSAGSLTHSAAVKLK